MIKSQLYSISPKKSVAKEPHSEVQAEFGRLIHAAIINKRFRDMLLTAPMQTIEAGYCGEKFHFPRDIHDRIEQIRAGSLEDFSSQLLKVTSSPNILEPALAQYQ